MRIAYIIETDDQKSFTRTLLYFRGVSVYSRGETERAPVLVGI